MTGRERVESGAGFDGDICDDKTFVMCGEMLVYCLWEYPEPAVDYEDKDEDGDAEEAELDGAPHL